MASQIQVKVAADVTSFVSEMSHATREVNKFSRDVQGIGNTLTRTGRIASTAASSIGTLGSVIPRTSGAFAGLAQTASAATSALGTAGIVIGETAVLSAGLTKGWALAKAAGGSLVPVVGEVAAAFGPVGIAIAGTVALLGGLAYAWNKAGNAAKAAKADALSHPFGPGVKSFELIDMTRPGRRENPLGPSPAIDVSATRAGGTADFILAATSARTATEQWQGALEGIRPITTSIVNDWSLAMTFVNKALQDQVNLTKDEVSELYRLKAALKDVRNVAPPLTTSEAVKLIKPIAPNQPYGLTKGLDPKTFLGDKFERPLEGLNTKTLAVEGAIRAGTQELKMALALLPLGVGHALEPRTQGGGLGAYIGSATGGTLGSNLGGRLGKGLGSLVGSAFGGAVGSVAGAWLGTHVGDFFGSIFGKKKRRAEDHSANALTKLALAAEKVTESISNLPTGIRVAAYRFGASDVENMPPVGVSPTSPKGTNIVIESLTVVASDPMELTRELSAESERAAARGGVTGLTLSTTRTARGV